MTPQQLKDIRLQAGLTQAQLASLLELSSQNLVSKYENGERVPSKQTQLLYNLLREGKLKHNSRQKAK
ncbi:MAG TPA: hypothetical protein DCX45_03675 [Acinetobacter junii]|nr:hypothetical protein [Acinetobacter junii]